MTDADRLQRQVLGLPPVAGVKLGSQDKGRSRP